MWGIFSKISSVIRDAERSSGSLPLTINDDLERGSVQSTATTDEDDDDDVPIEQQDDDEASKLMIDLTQVPFYVPHIEELYALRNGERVSVYRLRNYVLQDLELAGYSTRAQMRPNSFDMTNNNLDEPLVTDDMDTAVFFVNPADYHVTSWINAFRTRQTVRFRLPMVLMAIHQNFERRKPDPFEFVGTVVKPEHIDMLEKILREELEQPTAAAVAAAAIAIVTAPPTIEVHKKFDDVAPTSSSSLLDPEPAPPTTLFIETRSPIEQLILDNIRVFSRLLVDSGSEFVFLTELEAKFFFFWASSGHYLHSRIKLSKQQLDDALKEVDKARSGIVSVSSMLIRGPETAAASSRLAID